MEEIKKIPARSEVGKKPWQLLQKKVRLWQLMPVSWVRAARAFWAI